MQQLYEDHGDISYTSKSNELMKIWNHLVERYHLDAKSNDNEKYFDEMKENNYPVTKD